MKIYIRETISIDIENFPNTEEAKPAKLEQEGSKKAKNPSLESLGSSVFWDRGPLIYLDPMFLTKDKEPRPLH
ncbi:MAG: hypothetical protein PHG06_03680 [Parabacteroides sp.]|nr:hypothetical protein [Parabacteroides sp.]